MLKTNRTERREEKRNRKTLKTRLQNNRKSIALLEEQIYKIHKKKEQ